MGRGHRNEGAEEAVATVFAAAVAIGVIVLFVLILLKDVPTS